MNDSDRYAIFKTGGAAMLYIWLFTVFVLMPEARREGESSKGIFWNELVSLKKNLKDKNIMTLYW